MLSQDFGDPDIVVIGGGSAGCVLASRLSENLRLRVLLLEAGTDIGTAEPSDIVDSFPLAYANSAYFTTGLGAAVLSDADIRPYTQARLLGGGSSVMGMWALRGLADDFDRWSGHGALGWSHADVLPFFKRLETDLDFQEECHGRDGPITVRKDAPDNWPPFAKGFAQAALAHGYEMRADMNGDDRDGVFPLPSAATQTEGRRQPDIFPERCAAATIC